MCMYPDWVPYENWYICNYTKSKYLKRTLIATRSQCGNLHSEIIQPGLLRRCKRWRKRSRMCSRSRCFRIFSELILILVRRAYCAKTFLKSMSEWHKSLNSWATLPGRSNRLKPHEGYWKHRHKLRKTWATPPSTPHPSTTSWVERLIIYFSSFCMASLTVRYCLLHLTGVQGVPNRKCN